MLKQKYSLPCRQGFIGFIWVTYFVSPELKAKLRQRHLANV